MTRYMSCLLFVTLLPLVVFISWYHGHLIKSLVYYGLPESSLYPAEDFRAYDKNNTCGYLTFTHYGGRLGNQMFSYASTVGLAHTNHMIFLFPAPEMLAGPDLMNNFTLQYIFQLDMSRRANEPRLRAVTFDQVGESENEVSRFVERLNRISMHTRHAILNGYLQSWKYFVKPAVQAKLRRDFVFRNEIVAEVDKFYSVGEMFHGTNVTRVAVHVRRGDLISYKNRRYGYTIATKEYFKKASWYFISKFTNVQFVVSTTSGDMAWIREVYSSIVEGMQNVSVIYTGGKNAGVDMAVLARCQHTIMSTGSYGWWVAWLVNGTTIYYSNWPKPGSPLDEFWVNEDFFPPDWIPMT